MPVAVFGRLGQLLNERNLTVADVRQQIEALYGIVDDTGVLEQLASSEDLHTTDLTVVGAVAGFLGVSFDDLLQVIAIPVSMLPKKTEPDFLTEEEGRRLTELFDRQDTRGLTDEEQRELEELVYDKYGQRSNDYYRHQIAKRRGISVEQVQREEDERIAEAMKHREWLHEDPRRIQELAERVRKQKASASM